MLHTAKDIYNQINILVQNGSSLQSLIRYISELVLGWPYVFGAYGQACTPETRRKYASYRPDHAANIRNACPVLSGKAKNCEGCKWNGCLCFDCRGFTMWLLKMAGLSLYGGTVSTQWETESNWVAKGDISTLPKNLIACVFRPSHTGMYLGNGLVRHCSGTVKEEALPGNPKWQRWAIPAGLYSVKELKEAGLGVDESKNIPTIRKGCEGNLVTDLQRMLSFEGYDLEIDGKFGSKTEAAVKDFQQKNDLKPDGVVGPKTWDKLGYAQAPSDDYEDADEGQEDQEILMIPKETITSIAMQLNKCSEEMKKLVETLLASTF